MLIFWSIGIGQALASGLIIDEKDSFNSLHQLLGFQLVYTS